MSLESPQSFWIGQLETHTRFHMEIKDRVALRLMLAYNDSPFALPSYHVELGAGIEPMVGQLVAQELLANKATEVILSDFSYNNRNVALQAFKTVQTPLNWPNFHRSGESKIRLEQHLQHDKEGVPGFRLPSDWQDVHLAFSSLANYVAWSDLQQYIQHPSVRMISFINSVSAGPRDYFHPQRVASSEEIAMFIQNCGFLPWYEGMMVDEVNPAKIRFQPVIGGVYIRPQNEDQSAWIHNNHLQQTIPVYQ